MIFGLEIAMAIAGLIALFSGRLPLTNRRFVRGVPARLLGVTALLPFPLAFAGGFVVGFNRGLQGLPVDPKDPIFIWIEVGAVAICALIVFGGGFALSEETPPVAPVNHEEDPYGTDRLDRGDGEARTIPFNAKAVFTFRSDRKYRVYGDAESLYFIHLAGQHDLFANLSGIDPNAIRDMDRSSPKDLIGNHKHDFVVSLDDVASAKIDPPTFWGGHGKHVGSWTLVLQDGTKWNLQFEETLDMGNAITSLTNLLGDKITVNAKWDEAKQKYRS